MQNKERELIEAAKEVNFVQMVLLSKAGGVINYTCVDKEFNRTPLHWAISALNKKTKQQVSLAVNLLIGRLDRGAFEIQDIDGNTPLLLAACYPTKGYDIVKVLCEKSNLRARNRSGKTLFQIVEENRDNTIISTIDFFKFMKDEHKQIILEQEEEHKKKNNILKETPKPFNELQMHNQDKEHEFNERELIEAAKEVDYAKIKNHSQLRTNFNIVDEKFKRTPLHWAITASKEKNISEVASVVSFIADQSSNLEARDIDGNTPLLLAAVYSKYGWEVFYTLFQKNVNILAKNNIGKNLVEILRENDGPEDLLSLLTQNERSKIIFEEAYLNKQKKMSESEKTPENFNKPVATIEVSFAIDPKEVTIGEEIGHGGFGVVYKGTYRYNAVAIKELQVELSDDEKNEFYKEINIMARLHSRNIVSLYGIVNERPYRMVMEYLPKGDLYNFLHNKEQPLSWEQRANIALDIARGLVYLHKENLLHRDLKSKNILLDENLTAKLADFGLSRVRTGATILNTADIVGTLQWMAPELLQDKGAIYTLKADVYSYGVVVWELCARKVPFGNNHASQIKVWVSNGIREPIPQEAPKKLAEMIQRCWDLVPSKRPAMEEIVEELQQPATSSPAIESMENNSGPQYREDLDSNLSFSSNR